MKKMSTLIISLLILLAITTGCASSNYNSTTTPSSNTITPSTSTTTPSSNTTTPSASTKSVTINNFAFNPGVLTINKGDTVIWTNADAAVHSVVGGPLQSKNLAKGESYSYTFSAIGSFDYICSFHPSMKGSIIVK